MNDRLEAITERLRSIADDLDEVMFDELRHASASGSRRPAEDRTLLAVRRSVDKAIHLLEGIGTADSVDEG